MKHVFEGRLTVEGIEQDPQWKEKLAALEHAVQEEWGRLPVLSILTRVQEAWDGGKVLPPEIGHDERWDPEEGKISVSATSVRQKLVVGRKDNPSSIFSLVLTYNVNEEETPFSLQLEDLRRRPNDDFPLVAGTLDMVDHAPDASYLLPIWFAKGSEIEAVEKLTRNVEKAVRVRREGGLLPRNASINRSQRRSA